MCNGLPVIATNTGGIPFTIRDRQNGLLIPPKDSNAIKNAVKLLINDNSFRKKIISNGYICAENNTLEKHIQEVNSFIQDNCLKNNANKTILEHSFLTKVKRVIFRSIPIHIVMLITSLLPNSKVTNRIRGLLLKPFFKSCGKNLQVASGVIINVPENISIGNDVYIAHNAWINGAGGLIIENNVVIGPYSVIATTKHIFEDRCVNNTKSEVAPIRIGKGCWIASHAVITSGVTIGNGVLISAGAVVTKDLESDIMVGGVPAKFIRNM
jgi:maltose O-acetyltransferase